MLHRTLPRLLLLMGGLALVSAMAREGGRRVRAGDGPRLPPPLPLPDPAPAWDPSVRDRSGSDNAVRPAGKDAMRDPPTRWDEVDEASDESFPASDPSAKY